MRKGQGLEEGKECLEGENWSEEAGVEEVGELRWW